MSRRDASVLAGGMMIRHGLYLMENDMPMERGAVGLKLERRLFRPLQRDERVAINGLEAHMGKAMCS